MSGDTSLGDEAVGDVIDGRCARCDEHVPGLRRAVEHYGPICPYCVAMCEEYARQHARAAIDCPSIDCPCTHCAHLRASGGER